MRYKAVKRATICWAQACLWELSVAQLLMGAGLWAVQPFVSPGEPPIIVAMSAGALIFSGVTTFAAAAIYDKVQESGTGSSEPEQSP